MGVSNRRPKHRICNNTNEQKNGDDDRRNEVFHGLSLTGEPDRRLRSASFFFKRCRAHRAGSLSGTVGAPHYNMPESIAAARARQTSSIIA
jgi:hypothetical protein